MIKGLLYSVLLGLLILVVGSYLLYSNIIAPVSNVLLSTSLPLPTYANSTVLEVCRLLEIANSDPFCKESKLEKWVLSDQNARTLHEMLYRNFAIGTTTYGELMPLLKSLRSVGRLQSLNGTDFKVDGCSLMLEPDGDECMVVFPGEISIVWIFFNSHGLVWQYGVTGENGGSL